MDSVFDVSDDTLLEGALAEVNGKRFESAIALFTQAELAVSPSARACKSDGFIAGTVNDGG